VIVEKAVVVWIVESPVTNVEELDIYRGIVVSKEMVEVIVGAFVAESLVTLLENVKLTRGFATIVVMLVMSKQIVLSQSNKAMKFVTNAVSLVISLVIAKMKKTTKEWLTFRVTDVVTKATWQRTVKAAPKLVTTAKNLVIRLEIALRS